MTTIHVVRHCCYYLDSDVWLTELSNEGAKELAAVIEDPAMCEPCMAVVTSPPMIKADGGDDGRMVWHIHCLLRQNLRAQLRGAGYEAVATDGRTELWRGPSATVTVDWNQNWRAGS